MIFHLITNQAQCYFTQVNERGPVFSVWFGSNTNSRYVNETPQLRNAPVFDRVQIRARVDFNDHNQFKDIKQIELW